MAAVPISTLRPHGRNLATVKGRITFKAPIKSTKKGQARSEAHITDIDGETIKISMWGSAVEKFHGLLQEGQVYILSKARVVQSNAQYNRLENNKYEIQLEKFSVVTPTENDPNIPASPEMTWTRLDVAKQSPAKTLLNMYLVIVGVSDVSEFVSKQGKDLKKRELSCVDDSNHKVVITLWNDDIDKYEDLFASLGTGAGAILEVIACQVKDYMGKSINITPETILRTDQFSNKERAAQLRQWYSSGVNVDNFTPLANSIPAVSQHFPRKTCAEVNECKHEFAEETRFAMAATIVEIAYLEQRPPWYLACPKRECKNKKIVPVDANDLAQGYSCPSCGDEIKASDAMPRLMLRTTLMDSTGNQEVMIFHEMSEEILGVKATELQRLHEQQEGAKIHAILHNACFKTWVFGIRGKLDVVRDEERLSLQVVALSPIDYRAEMKR